MNGLAVLEVDTIYIGNKNKCVRTLDFRRNILIKKKYFWTR